VEPKVKLGGQEIDSVPAAGVIQSTYAMVDQIFPSTSLNIKVKLPLPVNV
jgi:hypothetical protein